MSDDLKNSQKITGYLEKRGKLKLMNSWKRYWFVLEGHLLLYYGSKEDYDGLSPCKGSITLGPTCNVKPYASTPSKFQITTRSGSVTTLRAESIAEQNKWMQAIFSTVNENQKVDISPTKLCHFRYSTERVDMLMNNSEIQKSNNSPVPVEEEVPIQKNNLEKDETQILERLQRMGARSYCDSIISNHEKIVNKTPKPRNLDITANDKVIANEKIKETATVSPRKLQFSPKIAKIAEELTTFEGKEIILEDEDYCVCTLDRTEDAEILKNKSDTAHRSISFTEAREVFNRTQQSSIKRGERNSGVRKNEKQQVPTKIANDKVSQPSMLNVNKTEMLKTKRNNNDLEDNNKEQNPEDHYDKLKPAKPIKMIEKPSDEIQNQDDLGVYAVCGSIKMTQEKGSVPSDVLALNENGKHASQISLIGAYYSSENEQETPPSYQDFREKELYAMKIKNKEKSEPNSSVESKIREEVPQFQFPPPPFDTYESIDDLTSDNLMNQNDNDSLYEEADDFVWQNEIYDSSVGQKESPVSKKDEYIDPFSYQDHKEIIDKNIEDDLYEEVDDDFVYQRLTKPRENELYNEPQFLEISAVTRMPSIGSDNDIYEEVDVQTAISFRKNRADIQTENELYEASNKDHKHDSAENEEKGLQQNSESNTYKMLEDSISERSSHFCRNDIEVDNDLYVGPKEQNIHKLNYLDRDLNKNNVSQEFQIENAIYAEPHQISHKNVENKTENDKNYIAIEEVQMDNELYAEPNKISFQNIRNSFEGDSGKNSPGPIFSRQNSRTGKGMQEMNFPKKMTSTRSKDINICAKNDIADDNSRETDEKRINNELYSSTFIENEIYSEPNLVLGKGRKKSEVDDETNVYEDPDRLMMRSPKIEKGKKTHKSEDLKKQDNFIQRLLKQVTRKNSEKGGKSIDLPSDNTEETLKLLGDIQVLLEKKKQFIKDMVKNPKPCHRRIMSEANAQIKQEDGNTPLMRTFSIDVNDEYSTVRDSLEDEDNEAIYSEVEMIDRSSKELRDLIEDLLKNYKVAKEGSDPQCTADKT